MHLLIADGRSTMCRTGIPVSASRRHLLTCFLVLPHGQPEAAVAGAHGSGMSGT